LVSLGVISDTNARILTPLIKVISNGTTKMDIPLNNYLNKSYDNAAFNISLLERPLYGNVIIPNNLTSSNLLITYVPSLPSYIGSDSLKFRISTNQFNKSTTDNGVVLIERTVPDSKLILLHPWAAVIISGGFVSGITLLVAFIISRARRSIANQQQDSPLEPEYDENCKPLSGIDPADKYQGSFWDIIREGDYYPSLARFQFFIWTVVIAFVFLSVYLIRISGSELTWNAALSEGTLAIMGISISSSTFGNILSRVKYDSSLSKRVPKASSVPKLSTMLIEGTKPVLFRYQLFIWTFIGVGIYLFVSFSSINTIANALTNDMRLTDSHLLSNIKVADIEPTIVAITGLSQAAYLAGKFTARTLVRILGIFVGSNRTVSIHGDNFGEQKNSTIEGKGIVLVNNDRVPDTRVWADNRIDFDVPNDIQLTKGLTIKVVTYEGIVAIKKYCGDITIPVISQPQSQPSK
jgi:hypothetical protein